ncbi:MAG: hypothetical protein GXY76_12170 [Chloroflexi bacterium]|nr:hypothetical protein [Chloroflexota bacterium]
MAKTRRPLPLLRICVCAWLLVSLLSARSPARAQSSREILLYEEGFDQGEAPGWDLEALKENRWYVEGQALYARGHALATYLKGEWEDLRLELTVQLLSPDEGLHINIRHSGEGRYYLALHPDRATLHKQIGFGAGERFIQVAKPVDQAFELKIPHGVSLSVYGGRVLAVVDGQTLFDWTDDAPLPAGAIGVETLERGEAFVDHVRVYGPAFRQLELIRPDLVVLPVEKFSYATDCQSLSLVATVLNGGKAVSGSSVLQITDPKNQWEVAWREVPALDPGGAANLEITAELPADQQGREHVLTLVIDPDQAIRESDEGNNASELYLPACAQAEPAALLIRGLDPAEGRRGETLTVRVLGEGFAPGTEVRILPDIRTEATDFVSPEELQARIAIPDSAEGGARRVQVVAPDGRTATARVAFGIVAPPAEPPPVTDTPRLVTPTRRVRAPTPTGPGLLAWPPEDPVVRLVLILVGGGVGLALVRRAIRSLQDQLTQSKPAGLPPLRLTRVWLTEGPSGQGRVISDREALAEGEDYTLHVQALPRGAAEAAAVAGGAGAHLDVVFYSPEGELQMDREAAALDVPPRGASSEVQRVVRPAKRGRARVRACIYYRNTLVQSVLVDADVARRQGAKGLIRREMDYVASLDLASMEALPSPALNIWTNQAADGTHWIGVFSSEAQAGHLLRNGVMHTFGAGELAPQAQTLRELWFKAEAGERGRSYRMALPQPLDVAPVVQRLERDLVELAARGRILYDALFYSRLDSVARQEQLEGMEAALAQPAIISVARCHEDGVTIPWAALYSLYLQAGKLETGGLQLCPIFKAQLADDLADPGGIHDLLDDFPACRGQAPCPVARGGDGTVVCPFGFWGIMHQIEQPLQQIRPTPVDQLPAELQSESFNQTSFLTHARGAALDLAMAAYPALPRLAEHRAEFEGLGRAIPLHVTYEEDRDRVLELLRQGGKHIYYFYCHGDPDDRVFKLALGPAQRPGYLMAADLDPAWRARWPKQPQPLVILNACETTVLLPEISHGFLGKLRWLGACGVIGTEIKVRTELAAPFGAQLVAGLLSGRSVGEVVLGIRHGLLRQANPLGLVYSYYSPATLHLHQDAGCPWCQAHPPTRAGRTGATGSGPVERRTPL